MNGLWFILQGLSITNSWDLAFQYRMWTYARNFYSTENTFSHQVTGLPHLSSLQWIHHSSKRALFPPGAERESVLRWWLTASLRDADTERGSVFQPLTHLADGRVLRPTALALWGKVWRAEVFFLTASAQPHFLSGHRDVPRCTSQQNSRVQILLLSDSPDIQPAFLCCLDVSTFS